MKSWSEFRRPTVVPKQEEGVGKMLEISRVLPVALPVAEGLKATSSFPKLRVLPVAQQVAVKKQKTGKCYR